MKKIFGICICLLLLVGVIVAPTAVFAENSAGSAVTIHFLNPTAIAVVGNNLFVADNVDIDANKSVILSFTLGASEATYRDTTEIDGNVTNLSGKGNDGLYAILDDKVIEYTIGANAALTITHEFNAEGELTSFVDCTYGQSGDTYTEYFLTQEGLYRKDAGGWADKFYNSVSSVAIDNFVYYLQIDENGKAVSKRYNGKTHAFPQGDVYNNGNGLSDEYGKQPLGLFAWENNVGVFWNDKIHYVEIGAQCTRPLLMDYNPATTGEEKITIKDVEANGNRLFVLNDKNLVEVYEGSASNMTFSYSVGSDTVNQTVPHDYTSFTLVRSKGYPSNLVFKTNEDTSIAELVTDAEEYLILGYEGDTESMYYYVLTNDNRFGWVQKTNSKIDNGKLTDDKLEVINTTVTHDSNVEYTTKFTSLNAVYIYKLPRSVDSFQDETFQQTASTAPTVTALQRFTEKTNDGDIVWYYVSFNVGEQTRTGFVQAKDLGQFLPTPSGSISAVGDRKINSTLFEAVKLYLYPDKELMTDDNLVTTENGIVKLYSGKRVTLLSEKDGVAFIQIQNGDGTSIFGYVNSNRLIGLHAITTNAIVGLTLLAVAIALATTLIVVFVKRKNGAIPKRKKEVKSED